MSTEAARRLERATAIAALATVALALTLGAVMPRTAEGLQGGWKTPIMAFELASSEQDLAFLAGPEAAPLRAAMDRGHVFDMAFPFAYGGLLALVLLAHRRRGARAPAPSGGVATSRSAAPARRARLAAAGVAFALLAVPGDVAENVVLLSLTGRLDAGAPTADLLPWLIATTWLKWGSIGLALAVLAVCEWPSSKIVAVAAGLTAVSVALAAASGGAAGPGEVMGLAVGVGFGLPGVRALYRWARPRPAGASPAPPS